MIEILTKILAKITIIVVENREPYYFIIIYKCKEVPLSLFSYQMLTSTFDSDEQSRYQKVYLSYVQGLKKKIVRSSGFQNSQGENISSSFDCPVFTAHQLHGQRPGASYQMFIVPFQKLTKFFSIVQFFIKHFNLAYFQDSFNIFTNIFW